MSDDEYGPNDELGEVLDRVIVDVVRQWKGPLVPERVLLGGALVGFDPDDAEAVLLDHRCQVYLNGVWTRYREATGNELPPVFQERVDEERRRSGNAGNLAVAHACGYGWTDEELADAFFMQLEAQPWERDDQALLASGGGVANLEEQVSISGDWDMQLRAQHVLILVRRQGGMLAVQVISLSLNGSFEVVLSFPDGSSVAHHLVLAAGRITWLAVGSAELPVSGSLRSLGGVQ